MKNGKGKGSEDQPKIILPNFGTAKIKVKLPERGIAKNIRGITDLINNNLSDPAELSGSSIPPRSTEPTAQVIKFKRTNKRSKRTVFSDRGKAPGKKKRESFNFNDWLMRENPPQSIDSITGGVKNQINTVNMAEEDERAKEMGYAGVRKVYLMIQNTIDQDDYSNDEPIDYDQHASLMAEKIKNAIQELEQFCNFRDEDNEPIYTDNPKDPRLFNAVASILIRVWGHNYLNKLNDLRVNTIVLLLNRGDVSWRKLIDLMAEWEKSHSVKRTVNRYNR